MSTWHCTDCCDCTDSKSRECEIKHWVHVIDDPNVESGTKEH